MIIPWNDYLTCRILEIETEKLSIFSSKFNLPFRAENKKRSQYSFQKIKLVFLIFSSFSKI